MEAGSGGFGYENICDVEREREKRDDEDR